MIDFLMYISIPIYVLCIFLKERDYPAHIRTAVRAPAIQWGAIGAVGALLFLPLSAIPTAFLVGYFTRLFYFDAELRHEMAMRALEQGDFGTGGSAGALAPPPADTALNGTRATPES